MEDCSLWQGEEIEYALTAKDNTDLTQSYAPDLIEALATYQMDKAGQTSPFLLLSSGKPSQFLINGGRAYVDEVHRQGLGKYYLFEITTPECRNGWELVQYDKAAELYARLASQKLREEKKKEVHCYKTSLAKSGEEKSYTTRGVHESFSVRKQFLNSLDLLVPFLVLRQIFCGAGGYYQGNFVISPRAFFLEKIYAYDTIQRPLICLRHESHSELFRLQILSGEGTRSQLTTFLKMAITSYVILSIQEGYLNSLVPLRNPLKTARRISTQIKGPWEIQLENGRYMDALEYLHRYYLPGIERLFQEKRMEEHDQLALRKFKEILGSLGKGRFKELNRRIEWLIKFDLIEDNLEEYFEFEEGIERKKEAANFIYTAVTDPTFEELEEELGIETVVSKEMILRAMFNPPVNSRASLRVSLAKAFGDYLEGIEWHNLTIKGKTFDFLKVNGWNEEAIAQEKRIIAQEIGGRT